MACTEHAGRWMFGDKEFDKGNVFILNNAIELEKFKYDIQVRETKRSELNIDDETKVIGCIGRFVEQKNHRFLIEIFEEYHKMNQKSILLLIGQGPLVDEIKKIVEGKKLSNSVLFLGQKNDVYNYYSVFDFYVMPSLYEGLGMVYIEAQVSGLPCLASKEVPEIVKVTENMSFLDLNIKPVQWAYHIEKNFLNDRHSCMSEVASAGYDIDIAVNELEEIYLGGE